MKLTNRSLPLVNGLIKTPFYDRKTLKHGIVHIGVGGFHRAHQGVVVQKLLESGEDDSWGICGVGLRENDRKIAQVFENQDCLYTLITRYPQGPIETEIMGQMIDFLFAPEDKEAVINRMANSDTKIVSLTITEGGYNLKSDGNFDLDHPDVQHDIHNPTDPRTIYGYLYAALKDRKDTGARPFTVMSCDNIQHNGNVARKMMHSFAAAIDGDVAEWIMREVAFPNSMVDRITPATTPEDINYLKENFDLVDEWPVTCESFLQWVIEDNFSDGRPDFDKVDGVQFVSDVTPYEKMKIRLLNAGHSVLGIFGSLLGIPTIDACVQDKILQAALIQFWDNEVTPILDKVEGIDLNIYKESLLERFGNPNIKDSVSRICSESSAKIPKFLLPTIRENLDSNGNIEVSTLVLAAWCYYSDIQQDQSGEPIEVIDDSEKQLKEASSGTKEDSLSFIRISEIFGDLANDERFTQLYEKYIRKIYSNQLVVLLKDLI